MNLADEVYQAVKRIPTGKVATYGQIANQFKISPSLVGQILHHNPDPKKTACHRVVDRNGRIAPNFAFGGAKEQRRRLLAEGVKFKKDKMHVDFSKSLWKKFV